MQAGHELLLLCDNDPGARQVCPHSVFLKYNTSKIPMFVRILQLLLALAHIPSQRRLPNLIILQVLKAAFPGVLVADDVASVTSLPKVYTFDKKMALTLYFCVLHSATGNCRWQISFTSISSLFPILICRVLNC
jgi:hypothetical protein